MMRDEQGKGEGKAGKKGGGEGFGDTLTKTDDDSPTFTIS